MGLLLAIMVWIVAAGSLFEWLADSFADGFYVGFGQALVLGLGVVL